MGKKVYIHQEEEGKHLFADKEDDNLFHGVQGNDEDNKVAGAAKFRAVDIDDLVDDELRKNGKVAVDIDDFEKAQHEAPEEFEGLSPEEQELIEFLGSLMAVFFFRVAEEVYKRMKPHIKAAGIALKQRYREWKESGTELDFSDQLFIELEKSLDLVTYDPDDVIYRQRFQKSYFEALSFSALLKGRKRKKWKRRFKSLNQADWQRAVDLCINNSPVFLHTDTVLLLEDKSLIRQLEKKSESVSVMA